MQQIRVWEVADDNRPREIHSNKIKLEEHLENWLESDVSLLDPNLLVIGRQVRTDFAKEIDLLCLDSNGDSVVVELKKGQTPRDVVAQALDYAYWVCDLPDDQIRDIANKYLGNQDALDEAFKNQFEKEIPNELNTRHRSLIVAESMDDSTERIVRYLSRLRVPINVATIQHFKDNSGRSILAQVYLIEPEEAEPKSQHTSGRPPLGTVNGLQALASDNGIGDLYAQMRSAVRGILSAQPYRNRVWYRLRIDGGGVRTVLIVDTYPHDQNGRMGFRVHATRLQAYLGVDFDELRKWLPPNTEEGDVSSWPGSSDEEKKGSRGLKGSFHTIEQVGRFTDSLRQVTLS